MVNQELKKTLWAAADKLRSNMDAAEYKHLVLGLIFLKYVSDTFSERRAELRRKFSDPADDYYLFDQDSIQEELEDRDYYTEANVFWVPETARWESIRNNAKQPDLGKRIDNALLDIEAENPRLKNILDKRFARTELEPGRLGELVDLVSKIGFIDIFIYIKIVRINLFWQISSLGFTYPVGRKDFPLDTEDIAQLTIQIDNNNISARRLNATTVKLKGELSRLNPVKLDLQRESESPKGTMSVEAFTLGALVLSVLPNMVPAVVDYLRDWCLRNKDHTITIKKRVGEEEIEVSFPQDLSSERLQRLLAVVSSSIDHPSSSKQQ